MILADAARAPRLAALAAVAMLGLASCSMLSPGTPATPLAIRQCEALAGMTIAASRIGLPSGGALIASAARASEVVPYKDAEGEHLLPTPARCLVLGRVLSIDTNAPPIQFAINLPLANWNGRALQSGGGGLGGQVITAPGNKASGRFDPNPLDVPYPVTQGYVSFGSDQGHPRGDFRFTRNDEAMRNWAFEEIKKTRDVALAVIEALRAAQKFPDDYDGVIATSPVLSWYAVHLFDNHVRDRLIEGGMLDARCADDAAQLQCAAGQGSQCLSAAQVAAVNALREPRAMGVSFAHGITRFPGFGVTGDEDGKGWQWGFYPIGAEAPSRPLPPGMGFEPRRGAILNFGAFLISHTIVQRDDFDPYNFDPLPHAARIAQLSQLFDATDPDLSRFAQRGGKLIIVHPSADNAAPLTMSAEYLGSVTEKLGAAKTDAFLRLYVPAGGSHNVGGASQVNALAMLEDWVLRGVTPPDAPVAQDLGLEGMRFIRSMPACRFPASPRYHGSGDAKQAGSFSCVARDGLRGMKQQ